jgi:hypothetical protein
MVAFCFAGDVPEETEGRPVLYRGGGQVGEKDTLVPELMA